MATYAVPKRHLGSRTAVPVGPACPNQAEHTPCPTGYVNWWSWAERMNRTHGQRQCEGCGRWAIWYERPPGELAPCWGCGETKVDAAAFGEDDELLCHGCQVERQEREVAGARAALQRRWADAT
jgi:hypothetical protein